MSATEHPDCKICLMEESDPASRVFSDDLWAAEVPAGAEVPGWFFLRTRRHAEAITGLNDAELASFGTHAQDMVAAVERATEAPRVYMMAFGENHQHFHLMITARGEEIPAEFRSAKIMGLMKDHKDPEAANAVAQKVKAEYEAILAERG